MTELGSQCIQGTCASGEVSSAPDCLVSVLQRRLLDDLEEGTTCAAETPVRDDHGLVPCEILWVARPGEPLPAELEQCTGALSPLAADDPNGPGCHVNQIPAPAAGTQPQGEGFYYSEELGQPTDACRRGFRYTPGLKLPPGARAELVCSIALRRASDGSVKSVRPESCAVSAEALAASASVGNACAPSPIPSGGLDDLDAHLDTAANGCGGSPCMVWHLRGDPSPECREQEPPAAICPSAEEVKQRAYCTCRCDLPADQQGPACRCPNDYSCTPVFDRGAFAGSYCVLSSTVLQP